VKRAKKGFTLVELLTTVSIIAILLAILLPAVNMVRRIAKEAEQKAQFNTIGLGLEAFKSDYGSYPGSKWMNLSNPQLTQPSYQGTQRLTEALVGMDLLGFHPDYDWRPDGVTNPPNSEVLYPSIAGASFTEQQMRDNLEKRVGPYLEKATESVFRLMDLYPGPSGTGDVQILRPDTYVICDVFKAAKVTIDTTGRTVRAGTPILYYKADTSKKTMVATFYRDRIYDVENNIGLLLQGRVAYGDLSFSIRQQEQYKHRLAIDRDLFYNDSARFNYPYKVIDTKVTTYKWPHRPDSYLLISAGWDGNFGTEDDIVNY